jgi:hypothetical protein
MIECEAFLGGSKLLPPERLKFRPAAYGVIVNDSFTFFFRCQPLTLNLIADDQVDDADSEEPRWLSFESLHAEQFQFLGVETCALMKA